MRPVLIGSTATTARVGEYQLTVPTEEVLEGLQRVMGPVGISSSARSTRVDKPIVRGE
jgi:hypothetical protein